MRFCELGDNKPVWGTDRKTGIGYCKSHQYLRTDISKETILQKAVKKQRQNVAELTGRKLRGLAVEIDTNKEMVDTHKSKSEQLKLADKVFGDWVKARDTKNGKVTCPCCKDEYFVDAVDSNGKGIIQPLHFVSRGVYDLRFDADNVHAGCCYCNLKQHLSPKGLEYQRYRKFLVNKIGETAVAEMELVKRKINRIEESQLKTVIEHYSNEQSAKYT